MSQKRDIPVLNHANYLAVLQRNGLSEDQFWAESLQKMIAIEQSEFVFTRLAKKARIPRKAGTKTWSTRRYLSLPVDLEKGKLTEGLAPTPMTVEGKMVSGTINQYGAYIELTDVADDVHFDDIFQIYQPEMARHAAETIERDLIAAVEAEASVAFAGSATNIDNVTEAITFEDLRRAWLRMKNHLRKGHPLAGGKPIFVAHPNILQDLLDDDSIVAELIIKPGYDSKIIKSGSIEEYTVYGIYLMETNVLDPKENANEDYIYRSFLVGNDAFVNLTLGSGDVKWFKKGFTADSSDPLGQKSTLGYRLWTGGKVIDPIAINVIYSTSSFDDVRADFSMDPEARKARQSELETDSTLIVVRGPNVSNLEVDEVFNPTGLLVGYVDTYGTTVLLGEGEFTLSAVDTSTAGTKTVTVTAKDIEGNNKTATFTVVVA